MRSSSRSGPRKKINQTLRGINPKREKMQVSFYAPYGRCRSGPRKKN